MRVLVVDLERAWRGGQNQALLLIEGMHKWGHSVELLSVRGAALAARAKARNLAVHRIPGAARRLAAAWRIRKLLRERAFDIVHANEAHALTAAWLAGAHHHTLLTAARRVTFPIGAGRISQRKYRAAARILAVSEAARQPLLAAGLDPQRLTVVADGVEIPELASSDERRGAREIWNLGPEETVLACVAALTKEKGHALLLEALALLKRSAAESYGDPGASRQGGSQRWRLLLAGGGPLRAQLERQVRETQLGDSVIFAGFVEEIRSVYAACDLFIFPSLQEGGGTSLLAAMAYALPVIAAASGGIKEILEDGRNGLLVQEGSPNSFPSALAGAISRLAADPALTRKLGTAARSAVAARFSAERMVLDTLNVFEELSGKSHQPQSVG